MKGYYQINEKNIKYSSSEHNNSELAKMERNDCVVRAIATLYEIEYEIAHKFVKDIFGRKSKDGTRGATLRMRELQEAFGKSYERLGISYNDERENLKSGDMLYWPASLWNPVEKYMVWPWRDRGVLKYARYTVGKFLKENPTGSFYILVREHAFAIVDGVVYGNKSDASALKVRIETAFKIG